jgi:hypothetical protein
MRRNEQGEMMMMDKERQREMCCGEGGDDGGGGDGAEAVAMAMELLSSRRGCMGPHDDR